MITLYNKNNKKYLISFIYKSTKKEIYLLRNIHYYKGYDN